MYFRFHYSKTKKVLRLHNIKVKKGNFIFIVVQKKIKGCKMKSLIYNNIHHSGLYCIDSLEGRILPPLPYLLPASP